jgi:hypothetical protein
MQLWDRIAGRSRTLLISLVDLLQNSRSRALFISLRSLAKLLTALGALVLGIAPLAYGVNGPRGLTWGLVAGLFMMLIGLLTPRPSRYFLDAYVEWLITGRERGPDPMGSGEIISLRTGLVGGLTFGVLTAVLLEPRDFLTADLLSPFIVTLTGALVGGLIWGVLTAQGGLFSSQQGLLRAGRIAVVSAAVGGALWGVSDPGMLGSSDPSAEVQHIAALLLLPVVLVAGIVCGVAGGAYLGARLRPGWVEFGKTGEYLKAMSLPVLGYALSYLLIVLWFAGCFASAQRWAESGLTPDFFPEDIALKNLPEGAGFGEYVYFSLVTAATVGYGDITPVSGITKILTSAEILVGVGWTVVVFGAVIAYLTPRFAEIADSHRPQPRVEIAPQMLAKQLYDIEKSVLALQMSLRDTHESLRALPALISQSPKGQRRPRWRFW